MYLVFLITWMKIWLDLESNNKSTELSRECDFNEYLAFHQSELIPIPASGRFSSTHGRATVSQGMQAERL